MALSDFEPYDTLTDAQGCTTQEAAQILFDLASGMLAPAATRRRRRKK